MRLSYGLELVAVVAAGLGLASWRMGWEDLPEFFGGLLTAFDRFEVRADAFLAGAGLAGGLATLAERFRRKGPWGSGRWAWVFVATYVILTQLDMAVGTIASRFIPGSFFSEPAWRDVLDGFRGHNGEFLFPAVSWVFASLGLVALAAGSPRDPAPDAREWCGRIFASLVVAAWLGLRIALWLGFRRETMVGGFR